MQAQQTALDPDGGGLQPLQGPLAVWFMAGQSDALDVQITITGNHLRANAPDYCTVNGQAILCNIPTLPAGKNFVLPMKGSNLSAVAVYKRLNGLSYSSQVRQ